ncbi:formin-like protein isoform X2 [Nematostella vectensis]|uniref:formin-like protein isoform X2 n=1 Tax=Nematostella vectensis TaxID=45351 RepID=UPI002076E2ED|nr:formin-like protein isoform X2 [Nematostella vectensis]
MVYDRNGNPSHGFSGTVGEFSGKSKNGMVRKSTARTFDSVRSTKSMVFSHASSGAEDTEFEMDEEMPDDNEIEERFSSLLEKMTLPAERAAELSKSPKAHKWKMIKAKELMQPKYTSGFYIEQLRGHKEIVSGSGQKTGANYKRLIKTLEPVEMVLRSLEIDLRTHPNTTWLREFIDDPYRGHMALVEFLQFLHLNPPSNDSSDDIGDTDKSKVSKKPGSQKSVKPDVLARSHIDEHLCLQSLRVLMKNKYGFQSVMRAPEVVKAIILCLKINNRKTQALVLKILTHICEESEHYEKVIDSVRFYTKTSRESRPFENIVQLIFSKPTSPTFQTIILNFINKFVSCAPSFNLKVFHQQEFEDAGLDVDKIERTLEGAEATAVREALKIWRDNYINVQNVMDEFVTLRERSKYLRDEVDLLQSKLEESEANQTEMRTKNTELQAACEEYRLRTTELQTALENLVKQVKNEAEAIEVPDDLINTLSEAEAAANPPEAPPLPPFAPLPPPVPPPPPAIEDPILGYKRVRQSSRVRLPMLNWVPVHNGPRQTFFDDTDEDEIMGVLDFDDFDRKFELKHHMMSEEIIARRETAAKRAAEMISVIDQKRARNLVIARRRIQHDTERIKELVSHCDLAELPSEHAELLLKFVPTKEELAGLSEHADEYDRLAEADQFMFQMAQVERYEAKLGVMTFIGVFDELMNSVIPDIESVLRAATSIINSIKLKKLFKIILIFGNYMNGSRRGAAHGFKLESLYKLEDTRTTDRRQSFLAYLVQTVRTHFPELSNFDEELSLDGASHVSLQTLAADVQGLRKGLDLTKSERDKQPNNFIIFNFYNNAFRKVQRVTERYRKMEETYTQVCTMFYEDPKKREPSEFFKTFTDFVGFYKRAEKEMDDIDRQEAAEANLKRMLSKGPHDLPDRASLANQIAQEVKRRSQYNDIETTIISI